MTKMSNPVLWMDIPDPDIIRVGDTFYLVSTTMHMCPGCPIMKSKDLLHWGICSYVMTVPEDCAKWRLENGENAYGKGQWAASLKEHNGTFYVAFCQYETQQTYIYTAESPESSNWKRTSLEGIYHDSSLLFDGDRMYIIYGNGDIYIRELDMESLQPAGEKQLLLHTPTEGIGLRCEGCHAYKIGEYYYLLFIEWPRDGHARRRQICYRSKELFGEYERRVVLDDDMGYLNQGVAQGGIVDDLLGNWYAVLFQDHGAVGRIPFVLPVTWEEDWPMMGKDGKVPEHFEIPLKECPQEPLIISDSFDHEENILSPQWQWNHAPESECWSFTERKGYLRLHMGSEGEHLLQTRNVLTQRTDGPICKFRVYIDASGFQTGDEAGLLALQAHFAAIGIRQTEGGKELFMESWDGQKVTRPWHFKDVWLQIRFDYTKSADTAEVFYSCDESCFEILGEPVRLRFTLEHFMGCRVGLFARGRRENGGYADFRDFRYREVDRDFD